MPIDAAQAVKSKFSVAPMMDWTDRHCRAFLRCFSPRVLLYTEMITAAAILRGDRARLLRFSALEQPVALQLGGSEPAQLAVAARAGEDAGYVEINLNCGCPSDRVSSGSFGACLMNEPRLVADCIAAMRAAVRIPVTVKMRIGVVSSEPGARAAATDAVGRFDDEDFAALADFTRQIIEAGSDAVIVHARKAVLGGLSPHDNRTVPPLRFDVVERLRAQFPRVPFAVNGGLRTTAAVVGALRWCDSVMIGREAYHRPFLLSELQQALYPEDAWPTPTVTEVLAAMRDYAQRELGAGERLSAITRHMLGLVSHTPGARDYRRLMAEGARSRSAGGELLDQAARLLAGAAAQCADETVAN